jgi:protein TonB
MSIPSDSKSTMQAERPEPITPAATEGGGSAPVTVVKPRPRNRPAARRPRPTVPRTERPPTAHFGHEEEKESFLERHALKLVFGAAVVAIGAFVYFHKPGPTPPPAKLERMVMIAPLPPPPAIKPPPPPPPQKPPEEKMEKETAAEVTKPVEKPAPAKAPEDPAPLGTNLKGDGAGLSGLGSGSGLGGGTLGNGGAGKGGSRFGWYAGQVQSKISEALRSNPKTKNANLRIEVRIWPDATGRITRAQLVGSTGDAALDGTIQNGVLTGLQLQEPPPAGMRLPIVLRLTARRPN